jgi:hypothetical protein
VKHAVQSGICLPTHHLLLDLGIATLESCRSVGKITDGPRQHTHSSPQVTSISVTKIFVFVCVFRSGASSLTRRAVGLPVSELRLSYHDSLIQ